MALRNADEWRVKLVLHYDGRNFCGWQKQRNQRTVQGELESLLERLCGAAPVLTGAGRTDRGVHATGQVASALIPSRFDTSELRQALNALAPPDLWIESAERVPEEFHPRYAASRTYHYKVGVDDRSRSPLVAPWCWPLGQRPDLEVLQSAARILLGRHHFQALAKAGQEERGFECDIQHATWRRDTGDLGAELFCFEIRANRFLHHMVRYLVGTLVEIGLGQRPVSELEGLLKGEAGLVTGRPAPAQGLFLARVEYSWQRESS